MQTVVTWIIIVCVAITYALCRAASKDDKEREKMAEKWKEEKEEAYRRQQEQGFIETVELAKDLMMEVKPEDLKRYEEIMIKRESERIAESMKKVGVSADEAADKINTYFNV